MTKCKILKNIIKDILENNINNFIEDKKVINISLAINPQKDKHSYNEYYACITYEE